MVRKDRASEVSLRLEHYLSLQALTTWLTGPFVFPIHLVLPLLRLLSACQDQGVGTGRTRRVLRREGAPPPSSEFFAIVDLREAMRA